MRARLLQLLIERSYRKQHVVLASGQTSDFFIDCKQTVLLAEGHQLVGEVFLDSLKKEPIVAVAGVELGGCPLASAVALTSARAGRPLDALYVRKDQKDHGSKRTIEGCDHLAIGAHIALLEDVVTTGGSTLKAVAKLHDAGFVVHSVWALVDRQEGGADAIREAGLQFESIFKRADFPH